MKIKSISRSHYIGKVYNIGTKPHHNYYAEGILVHNCYMNSTNESSHVMDAVDKIEGFFGPMTMNQRPFQVACLHSDTPVFGPNGMVIIKDLKIGDYLYDSMGRKASINNIIKRKRKCVKITGDDGWSVICTPDHPFIVAGKITKASDLLGKKVDKALFNHNDMPIISLLPYINKSSKIGVPKKRGGSTGGRIIGDKCSLMHNSPLVPASIQIDKDIMWLYGLTVAEGDYRGLTLGPKEQYLAERAVKIYSDLTDGLSGVINHPKPNVTRVTMEHRHLFKTIFFKIMGISSPAAKKNINFLFGLDKELIRAALEGMFAGDGCYRKTTRFDKKYPVLSYKTCSKHLAQELVFLLNARFDIGASLHYGKNKERLIEGRILKESDYYQICIYGVQNISKLFPDIIKNDKDLEHIGTSKYSHTTTDSSIIVNKIEDVGVHTVYDITLDDNSDHIFILSHGVLSHNCGGGNPNEHPYFPQILKKFDELKITPNYTTNGMGLTSEVLDATEKYCGGVALSCHPHLTDYWVSGIKTLSELKNIKLSYHHIIIDVESVDRFLAILNNPELDDLVSYHVMLPQVAQGRAKNDCQRDAAKYLFDYIEKLPDNRQQKIAFGARFYDDLLENKDKLRGLSLYGPEDFSKFLDLKDMKIYGSSFEATAVELIELEV